MISPNGIAHIQLTVRDVVSSQVAENEELK